MLFVQYANPAAYPPIEHATRILADAGWSVICLGIGGAGAANTLELPPHRRVRVRRLPYRAPGWNQKTQYARFVGSTLASALALRPTWVYASDPLACLPALVVSGLLRVPVVYHEHDSPGTSARGPFMRIAIWARRRIGQRAEICVLPNFERARVFKAAVGRAASVTCVPNYPRRDEIGPPRTTPWSETLRVSYHGTLVPQRLPRAVLQALALLPERVRLRLVGYETIGSPGFGQQLMDEAIRLRIGGRVEVLPAASRAALWRLSADQDVGLAFVPMQSDDVNMQYMVGASNKATDYLAAGLALLVTDRPEWRSTYVDPGYGLSAAPDSASSIASALQWFMEHREQTRAMGERGRQRLLADWNYERAFEPLLTAMSGGCASNRNRSS